MAPADSFCNLSEGGSRICVPVRPKIYTHFSGWCKGKVSGEGGICITYLCLGKLSVISKTQVLTFETSTLHTDTQKHKLQTHIQRNTHTQMHTHTGPHLHSALKKFYITPSWPFEGTCNVNLKQFSFGQENDLTLAKARRKVPRPSINIYPGLRSVFIQVNSHHSSPDPVPWSYWII